MALCPVVRDYLFNTDNGRLLGGNSGSAVRMGHASAKALVDFFATAHANLLASPPGSVSGGGFEAELEDLRFAPFTHGVPRVVYDAGMGFPLTNVPPLDGQTLYHVMKLRYLYDLVDSTSALATDVTLPVGVLPRDPVKFMADWDAVPPDERHFTLANFLGRPVVWFTDEAGAEAARQYSADTGIGLADAFCEVLGLGHNDSGEWMVLLHLPGSAVQSANHYRPLFCDGVKHRYFMAHSCVLSATAGPWGQTANLRELALGAADYDGTFERVAHQIAPSHFGPTETIHVEMLGPVARGSLSMVAPKRLADDVWARRRAK